VVVVICGGGTRLTVNVADLLGSVFDVPVNVATLAALTEDGAL
jgi:hypothetical protein